MFFKRRKAQGLSLNIIIIAVLALIVLVVIIIMFTGKTRSVSKTIDSCVQKGGSCETKEKCNIFENIRYSNIPECKKQAKVCCVPMSDKKAATT